jgi:hypothetical protein
VDIPTQAKTGLEWATGQKVIVEGLQRQGSGSSHQLLNLA